MRGAEQKYMEQCKCTGGKQEQWSGVGAMEQSRSNGAEQSRSNGAEWVHKEHGISIICGKGRLCPKKFHVSTQTVLFNKWAYAVLGLIFIRYLPVVLAKQSWVDHANGISIAGFEAIHPVSSNPFLVT